MKESMMRLFNLRMKRMVCLGWPDSVMGATGLQHLSDLQSEKIIDCLAAHVSHTIFTENLKGFSNKIKVAKGLTGYRDEDYFFSLIRNSSLLFFSKSPRKMRRAEHMKLHSCLYYLQIPS